MNVRSYATMLGMAFVLGGCSFGATSMSASSHFAYPNSNVTPMGPSQGSHGKLCGILFVNWGSPDASDQDDAVREAISKVQGGNLMLDVRADNRIFMVPGLFSICSVSVTGTVAKMEVGRQELGAAPPRKACKRDKECPGDEVCADGFCSLAPLETKP